MKKAENTAIMSENMNVISLAGTPFEINDEEILDYDQCNDKLINPADTCYVCPALKVQSLLLFLC